MFEVYALRSLTPSLLFITKKLFCNALPPFAFPLVGAVLLLMLVLLE